MDRVTVPVECTKCHGTGLYSGMREKGGLAVVCLRCDGEGHQPMTYRPFLGRREPSTDVTHVLDYNLGVDLTPELAADWVLPVSEWTDREALRNKGRDFVEQNQCPGWYSQSISKVGLSWRECVPPGIRFSDCPKFAEKEKCWDRYRLEFES